MIGRGKGKMGGVEYDKHLLQLAQQGAEDTGPCKHHYDAENLRRFMQNQVRRMNIKKGTK